MLQTALGLAGKGAADSSLEKRSGMRVRQTRGRLPPSPSPCHPCLLCIHFHLSAFLPAVLLFLLPEPQVRSHRACLAGKGTHRMGIGKVTLGMSQPPLPPSPPQALQTRAIPTRGK